MFILFGAVSVVSDTCPSPSLYYTLSIKCTYSSTASNNNKTQQQQQQQENKIKRHTSKRPKEERNENVMKWY